MVTFSVANDSVTPSIAVGKRLINTSFDAALLTIRTLVLSEESSSARPSLVLRGGSMYVEGRSLTGGNDFFDDR